MELGGLSRAEGDESFRGRLESIKRLAEEALRSVRNLALLLRPSMLDDLGLEPALRWQAKEFSRRSGNSRSAARPKLRPDRSAEAARRRLTLR